MTSHGWTPTTPASHRDGADVMKHAVEGVVRSDVDKDPWMES
jgi:hypothetical protein